MEVDILVSLVQVVKESFPVAELMVLRVERVMGEVK